MAVDVQPFAPVRVTEYVAATLTEIPDVVAPVLHRNVPVPIALKLTDEVVQVNVALLGEITSDGGFRSSLTLMLMEDVQPFVPVNVTE